MNVCRKDLGGGIFLTAIRTDKFKAATLSATFLAPLEEDRATVNALVPLVLRRGSEDYPAMGEITAALDDLYGGTLDPATRKKGETQCLGLIGSFLDEPYALEGEAILTHAVRLLTQLLLHPVTENGVFKAEYVAGEKFNLLQAIRSQMNDKRSYAMRRLMSQMCEGERYGVDRLGREEDVEAITPESAWAAYRSLLEHAPLELFYCGSASVERIEGELSALLSGLLPLRGELWEPSCQVRENTSGTVRRFSDRMDVTQGKLTLGFRTGGACVWRKSYPALLVFNAVYGGTSTSKLFMNVREKLSLCYYASSVQESMKGIVAVSSGVEFDRMKDAEAEILAQLDAIRRGQVTDDELKSGKQSIANGLRSTLDSRAGLETYWLANAVAGLDEPPEALLERVEAVTLADVVNIAKNLELDAVYTLLGKEDGENG